MANSDVDGPKNWVLDMHMLTEMLLTLQNIYVLCRNSRKSRNSCKSCNYIVNSDVDGY